MSTRTVKQDRPTIVRMRPCQRKRLSARRRGRPSHSRIQIDTLQRAIRRYIVAREHVSPGLPPRDIQQFPFPPSIRGRFRDSDDVLRLEIKLFVDCCGIVVQRLDY